MPLQTIFKTDVGMKRDVNEDSVSICGLLEGQRPGWHPFIEVDMETHEGRQRRKIELATFYSINDERRKFIFEEHPSTTLRKSRLLIVADGMGGHKAGEVASMSAVKKFNTATMANYLVYPEFPEKAIEVGYTRTTSLISEMAKKPEHDNMGTTLVSALICENKAYVGNIGDSRAYLLSGWSPGWNGKGDIVLKQVSKDHSFVQALVDAGAISPEEAFNHPQKNIITKSIGKDASVEPDIFPLVLKDNDVIMLCSDGLHDMLTDDEMTALMASCKSIFQMSVKLVTNANKKGGKDNITVALAHYTK